MKEYNKAVRDRIPEIICSQKKNCKIKEFDDSVFLRYMEYKLLEKLEEYLDSQEVEELADLIEVIYRVAELRGVTLKEREEIRQTKAEEQGRFTKNRMLIFGEEENAEPKRNMIFCTCERGDHIFEDE